MLRLSPDAMLSGTCSAQNLNGFSPALIRQAQAASGSSATLRKCDLNFTGTEFADRWLAQDGARQGLSAEEARAKYLAGTLLVSLDPQTADDPLTMQLVSASQIFLSQPSRLNIQLAPPGGLKFPDSIATIGLLFQGASGAKTAGDAKAGAERNGGTAELTPHGHFTMGGMDDRIASTLPPVFRPNVVPRSYSRLNST